MKLHPPQNQKEGFRVSFGLGETGLMSKPKALNEVENHIMGVNDLYAYRILI